MALINKLQRGLAVVCNDRLVLTEDDKEELLLTVPEPILPENLTRGQINVLKKEERYITSMSFSKNEEYVVLTTENKQLVVFNKSGDVIKNIIVNRAASKVLFTSKNDIIVADKTGDVYLYEFNCNEPVLLLGHLSVILDVALSECEKFIITCDRDEKIRVSKFPNAYNIVSFCLGHKEFVTNLKIFHNTLLSASGDGTVRFWDYTNGKQLGTLNSNEFIKDVSLLDSFSKSMVEEKVDVTALPIVNMQIYDGAHTYLLLHIHNLTGLQLYTVNMQTYTCVFVNTILQDSDVVSFCLSSSLYVLSDVLTSYNLDNHNISKINSIAFKDLNLKSVHDANPVAALYKRRFDNLQDYYEKKRHRLSCK